MSNGSGWLVRGGRGRAMDDRLRDRLSSLEHPAEPGIARRTRATEPAGCAISPSVGPAPSRTARSTVSRSISEFDGVVRDEGLLVIDRSVADLTSRTRLNKLLSRFRRAGRGVLARDDLHDDVRELLADPTGALFIDTETTGLAGSVVFLLGAMRVADDDIRLVQVFARDYAEERELARVWSTMLEGAARLVSFNGKSFDVPVLRDRLGYHSIMEPAVPPHLDLLHHARRRWGGRLPDCRLQTLERELCGRKRSGDIPGDEIPGVYHHFVKTGEADDILTVFHHNALDIMTLADIALALAAPEDEPS